MFWTIVGWVLLLMAAFIFLKGFIGMWVPSFVSPKDAPPLPWWKFALMACFGPVAPLMGAIMIYVFNR